MQYNLPTIDDLAMLIVGNFSLDNFKHNICIETRNQELKGFHLFIQHIWCYNIPYFFHMVSETSRSVFIAVVVTSPPFKRTVSTNRDHYGVPLLK
jgi:hypothetical protein